jgi:hypothetical protein
MLAAPSTGSGARRRRVGTRWDRSVGDASGDGPRPGGSRPGRSPLVGGRRRPYGRITAAGRTSPWPTTAPPPTVPRHHPPDARPLLSRPRQRRRPIAILSYDGHLAFGVTGDADAGPDVAEIAARIEAQMTTLRAHADLERDGHRRGRARSVAS